jgi:hypothetical protein
MAQTALFLSLRIGCNDHLRASRQTINRISSPKKEKAKMKKGVFPPGWDAERVKRVLAHYESQSEEETVAEDEAAFEAPGQTSALT